MTEIKSIARQAAHEYRALALRLTQAADFIDWADGQPEASAPAYPIVTASNMMAALELSVVLSYLTSKVMTDPR